MHRSGVQRDRALVERERLPFAAQRGLKLGHERAAGILRDRLRRVETRAEQRGQGLGVRAHLKEALQPLHLVGDDRLVRGGDAVEDGRGVRGDVVVDAHAAQIEVGCIAEEGRDGLARGIIDVDVGHRGHDVRNRLGGKGRVQEAHDTVHVMGGFFLRRGARNIGRDADVRLIDHRGPGRGIELHQIARRSGLDSGLQLLDQRHMALR